MSIWDKLRADYGLGAWTLYGALYNTPPNVGGVVADGKGRVFRHQDGDSHRFKGAKPWPGPVQQGEDDARPTIDGVQ